METQYPGPDIHATKSDKLGNDYQARLCKEIADSFHNGNELSKGIALAAHMFYSAATTTLLLFFIQMTRTKLESTLPNSFAPTLPYLPPAPHGRLPNVRSTRHLCKPNAIRRDISEVF